VSASRRFTFAIRPGYLRAALANDPGLTSAKIFLDGKHFDGATPLTAEQLADLAQATTARIGGEVRFQFANGSFLALMRTSPEHLWIESSPELPS
jgi:argininosuccinate synthase